MNASLTAARRLVGGAYLLAGLLLHGAATAGIFSVNPIRATLSAGQPVSAFTVTNNGDQPSVIQLELVSWSQQDGQEVYVPTADILATPPIFTVPPGGSQLVRVGMRRKPDPGHELTYRLFLQEVAGPPKPDFNGLQVALRIGVPVFVLPPVPSAPMLHWQSARTASGQLKLSVHNSGNAHVQVANFKLLNGAAPLLTLQTAAYVLQGQQRSWIVKLPAALGETQLTLAARTDSGDVEASLATLGDDGTSAAKLAAQTDNGTGAAKLAARTDNDNGAGANAPKRATEHP